MKNLFVFWLLFLFGFNLQAQQNDTLFVPQMRPTQEYRINDQLSYVYQKPKFFEFITRLPHDFKLMGNSFVQKDNLAWFGAAIGGTLALIPIDQQIIDSSRDLGDKIGFESGHTYSGPIKMFPTNINSAIFRLGNGFTALVVGGGLLVYGFSENDYRALHTSSEIIEGLIASGLLVQPLKRITGRECPFIAEENGNTGGNWNFFPSFAAYQQRTPAYDAMPSGHLTTLMTTVMIISENYKEYRWIKPVGFTMMGLMGFEMLQSKVHWASDYPIAIFMGYIIGKNIVKSRITEKKNTELGASKKFAPKFGYTFNSAQNFNLIGVKMAF
ncbi:MAG: phosphatase PAP2 family protein [Flavobacterium sp.]